MEKKLFQKTVCDVYKNKEFLGYKIFETDHMFVILWNNQKISGLNVAHCEKFTQKELVYIDENMGNIEVCIASDLPSEINTSRLKYDEKSTIMILEPVQLMNENENVDIRLITNQQELNCFCQIAGEVFHMEKDILPLQSSLSSDLSLDNCLKYIAYKNDTPAGIIEIARGNEAALISWVGVKESFRRQGLCHAMLSYAINREMAKGCDRFVLVASEMGQKVYSCYGFKKISERYDYILESQLTAS